MEHFDWWKHLSGYSMRIRDKLLFDMKLLTFLRILFANLLASKLFASAYLHTLNTEAGKEVENELNLQFEQAFEKKQL